jgi:single-stranded DNA-specific DHH superfamily exonuclease
MLSKKQIEEIRDSLEKSQNPLFFFDNDVDGFCSFIILQKAIGRGKGVAIKSFPDLDKTYLRKVEELNPDHVFILDKPQVSKEFIDGVFEKAIPITWIDHHGVEIDKEIKEMVNYFNSFPTSEPTTYLAYKIFERKVDQWLAITGCIGDNFMPEFAKDYAKDNNEFLSTIKSPFDCMYKTEIGKITSMINFGLKDSTTNVLHMIRLFIKSNNPIDILDENIETKHLHQKYDQLIKHLNILLKKRENVGKNLILLEYAGETSMSSELANKLQFENPDKHVLVIYKKQDVGNISMRGKKAKEYLMKAMKGIDGAMGGGHEEACGARIPTDNLEEFKNNFEKLVNQ